MCMNGLLVIMAFGPLFGLWPSSFFVLPRDHGPHHFMLQNWLSFPSLICMCEALSGSLERLVLTKDVIIKILSKQEILLMDLPRLIKKTIGK